MHQDNTITNAELCKHITGRTIIKADTEHGFPLQFDDGSKLEVYPDTAWNVGTLRVEWTDEDDNCFTVNQY